MKNNWITWLAVLSGLANRRLRLQIEYLKEQNRVLEEYIHTQCGKKRIRLTNKQRRRLAVKAKPLGHKILAEITDLFSPSTLLGWYRKLIAQKYDGSPNRKGGKPKISKEIIDVVIRLAKENRGWGHRRIRSYVIYLGYSVSISSVLRIMEDHGFDPGGKDRKGKTTWNEFVRSHMNVMAATDFFNIELLTKRGIVRVMVLFVIHLGSRRVEIAGIKSNPDANWVKQMACNLTDPEDGFLKDVRYLVHDRDPLFGDAFADILAAADIEAVKIQPKAPDMSPFAERFVQSIKSECLSKMILTSEEQLKYACSTYLEWYHRARPHAGLAGQMINPYPQDPDGEIICFEHLGGLLKSYRRVKKAA